MKLYNANFRAVNHDTFFSAPTACQDCQHYLHQRNQKEFIKANVPNIGH